MNEFIETFKCIVKSVLESCPDIKYEWMSDPDEQKETVIIHKESDTGFNIKLECFTYGIYPSVDDWDGAAWDVTCWELQDLQKEFGSFLRYLLSPDSELIVTYANDKPFKWNLRYPYYGKITDDMRKTIVFNWFGERKEIKFQNKYFPPNQSLNSTLKSSAN